MQLRGVRIFAREAAAVNTGGINRLGGASSVKGGVPPLDQRRLDRSGKKKAISVRAVSSESEPCTEFASIDSAKALRMVPGAALAGSVAAMISRLRATALSPSSTWMTTGPEVMNLTRSLKNGRLLWTS